MKLNLAKCTFGATLGKFLGYMIAICGIEANAEKAQATKLERAKKIFMMSRFL